MFQILKSLYENKQQQWGGWEDHKTVNIDLVFGDSCICL